MTKFKVGDRVQAIRKTYHVKEGMLGLNATVVKVLERYNGRVLGPVMSHVK